ncbi:prickle-like protein 4 isoform X2 [Heterocephalus glaber]|uniref:Prickle-like protein 4 isoform X2 n=1 Tax=Heterocephalus glaber TaxID=10181 RepID=A0AAX6T4F8_HETGA|nr:prickle-like protein 4 isoform X2 [Heterocephalus glaber]
MDRTQDWGDTAESPSPPLDPQQDGAWRIRDHVASWPPGTEMSEEVAAPGPEGEHPILATFHRKPELGDRTGRKQNPAAPSMDPPRWDTSLPPNWPGVWTLLQQLPPQDSDERYCLALGEEELAELRLFCAQRKQKALGQGVAHLVPPELEGHTCEKCRQQLKPGEVGVFAAPEGEQRCWHWPCFACQACGQVLMHLIYFYHDGRLYCGRHHAELLRPRCPACDQLIFSRRCTEAEGRRWHENHFCCLDCAGPLAGGSYTLPGGSPCCPSCFESRYPDTAGAPEGQALPGKGAEGAGHSGRGGDRFMGYGSHPRPPPAHPSSSGPTSPPTPPPHLGGPQLSPRVPGCRAPTASRAYSALRLGGDSRLALGRRGLSSGAQGGARGARARTGPGD